MTATLGAEGTASVIVPLMARDLNHLGELLSLLGGQADAVEWRLDAIADLHSPTPADRLTDYELNLIKRGFALIRERFSGIVIATYRTEREGGLGLTRRSVAVLSAAAAAGPDLVDVEWSNPQRHTLVRMLRNFASQHQVGIILSSHNFHGGWNEASELYETMRLNAATSDIVKIAVQVEDADQLCGFLNQAREICRRHATSPHLLISMGQVGQATRVYPHLTGSAATFAALTEAEASAPGQVTLAALRAFDAATHCLRRH